MSIQSDEMKNYLLLQSVTDFLVLLLCNVHKIIIHSHPLNEHWMERAWSPLCCHRNVTVANIMELCDEYNNCRKFQFYTEVFRDFL